MTCLCPTGWGWLPILYAAGTMLSFLITYSVAVISKDIPAFLPAISDTGSYPIESNIFGFLMSLSCVLGGLNFVVRYLQVDLMIRKWSEKQYRNIQEKSANWNVPTLYNKVALISSGIIMINGFVIGTFPNVGKSSKTHFLATALFFSFAYIFCVLQTIITGILTQPHHKWLYRIRVTMIVVITITIVSLGAITFLETKNKGLLYVQRRIADGLEWCYALLLCLYIATFTCEFEELKITLLVE